jgi:hypothetical protein
MDRTRPAELIPGSFAGHEADQVQDVSQGNPGPDFGEVDSRHGGSPRRNHERVRAGDARGDSGGNRVPTALAVSPTNRPMLCSELTDHSSDSES